MTGQHRMTRRLGSVNSATTPDSLEGKFIFESTEQEKNSATANLGNLPKKNGNKSQHRSKPLGNTKWKKSKGCLRNRKSDHASDQKGWPILKIHRNCLNFADFMCKTSRPTRNTVGDFTFGETFDLERHTPQLRSAMNWSKHTWRKSFSWICLTHRTGSKIPFRTIVRMIQTCSKIWRKSNCLWSMTSGLKKSQSGWRNNCSLWSITAMKTTFRSLWQAINPCKISPHNTNHKLRQDWTKCASLWNLQEKIAGKTNALHFNS